MTNSQTLGTIEATNPVLAVAPLKEETEMLRATDKITALYCRLSVEDMNKNGGKEDESNSIQNQKMILLQYAKENRFPNPTFFVDDGYSGTNYDRPGFQAMLAEIEAGRVAVCITKDLSRLGRNSSLTGLISTSLFRNTMCDILPSTTTLTPSTPTAQTAILPVSKTGLTSFSPRTPAAKSGLCRKQRASVVYP